MKPKAGGVKNYTQIISKSLKLEGINFSQLFFKANESRLFSNIVFEEFKDTNIRISIIKMN